MSSDENNYYSDEDRLSSKMIRKDGDEYEESSSGEIPPPDELEASMIQTIVEFSEYVAAITKDLEEQEQRMVQECKENGREIPDLKWKDSTFKINFTKGLLLHLFKPARLIKYYIIMVLPMKPWLENRDANFFIKNDHIYPGAPVEDIQFFKDLWIVDGATTPEEKDTFWEFFDTLIEITEDWHEVTGWEPHPDEDLIMPNIDYGKAAKHAAGEKVEFEEREVYTREGGGSWIANLSSGTKVEDLGLKRHSDEDSYERRGLSDSE